MKLNNKLSIILSIVIVFFLVYGLAYATGESPNEPASSGDSNATKTIAKNELIDLNYFTMHIKKGMTKSDMIKLFGEKYRIGTTDQAGEPFWMYDFPADPTYKTKVPATVVDEEGILNSKMRYQLSIVWDGDKIKSYIVFYNNNGSIGELKGKFFEGYYTNE